MRALQFILPLLAIAIGSLAAHLQKPDENSHPVLPTPPEKEKLTAIDAAPTPH